MSSSFKSNHVSVAIIGGGAAGCFAAANIPHNSNKLVAVFEKTGRLMQKVKVSGGGRCNTTHNLFDIPELITRYPRGKNLIRKTLYDFSPEDTISWFAKRGVTLKAEADGRMFPVTDDSQTIIDCIHASMMKQQATVYYNKILQSIDKEGEVFRLEFADNTSYTADNVIIACGGYPKESQYDWLKALGHSIKTPVPSLFTFNMPKHSITQLMGVSVPNASVRVGGTKIKENGPVLITHWGLSGPAILRTSAWGARELADKSYQFEAVINWLGEEMIENNVREIITQQRAQNGKGVIQNKNPFELPRRLWEYLIVEAGATEGIKWGDLPAAMQNRIIVLLTRYSFQISGKTTYKDEFVACGGVSLTEIDGATMQSKLVPNLYFAGEIIDVDGITGGFNFQHAWASGYAAAQAIAQPL